MADRILDNPATGERFVFTDAGTDGHGRIRQLRYEMKPGAKIIEHSHPGVSQYFEVVSGVLHVRTGGKNSILKPGDRVACGLGANHQQWNEGSETVVLIEGYDPPLDIEPFFRILAEMGGRGEIRADASPKNPLKFAVFARDFAHITRMADPMMRAMINVLGFVGSVVGYKDWYKEAV